MIQQETAAPARPLYARPWPWVAAVAVVALIVAGALLFPDRTSSRQLSFDDQQACDALQSYGLSAVAGDQDAAELLYVDLKDAAPGGPLSDDLSAYAQIVDASAQLVSSGADSPRFAEYVGQMRGVCETLGWRSGS